VKKRGFTLIEMLVVIAIIALLAAILIPTVTGALARGQSIRCANNMRGLAQAMMQYTLQTKHQVLPMNRDDSQPSGQWAWSYRLLEEGIFPEYGSVGELLRHNEFFRCPSDKGPGADKPSFAMNTYISTGTGSFAEYRYLSTIKDPSETILFGEVWGRRDDAGYTKVDPNSGFAAFERHKGKANYAFLDGHVETLHYRQQIEPDDEAWIDLWRPDL
jgi:prepilin-type N-terminal cleavage/methylation domain-containing protein/prepilin-type processing-associated H-X9-DG protein